MLHLEILYGKTHADKGFTDLHGNFCKGNHCKMQRSGIAFRYTLTDVEFFQFAVKGGGCNVKQSGRLGFISIRVIHHFLDVEFFGTG